LSRGGERNVAIAITPDDGGRTADSRQAVRKLRDGRQVVVREELDKRTPALRGVHPAEVLVLERIVETAERAVRTQGDVVDPS
jgi:hypothetical protein